jgi:hypothetical protein
VRGAQKLGHARARVSNDNLMDPTMRVGRVVLAFRGAAEPFYSMSLVRLGMITVDKVPPSIFQLL